MEVIEKGNKLNQKILAGGWGRGAVLFVELRSLYLLGKFFPTWAMPPAFFALLFFWDGVSLYAWAGLDCDPPVYASHVAGMLPYIAN
jgi:hypothetical protein